ncbi:hypothetical protein D3C84_1067370 [compost metagenome]
MANRGDFRRVRSGGGVVAGASLSVPIKKRNPCRSELARDGLEGTAGNQISRLIVNDHREQARSYRGCVN